MKFSIEQKALAASLRQAKRFTELKTMPILSSVVITADKADRVRFQATDLEISIKLSQAANVTEQGVVVVPVRQALALVSKLKGMVTVESAEDDSVVFRSESQGFSAKLAGNPFDEYPTLPTFDQVGDWVASQALARAFKTVLHAVGKDMTRYNLNGICIDSDGEPTVRCIATDGHRLAVADAGPISLPWSDEVILPLKVVKLLIPLLSKVQQVRMVMNGTHQLQVSNGEWSVCCRLIEGEFPNWKQVVPREITETIQVDRDEFADALASIIPMAPERSRMVRLVINGDIRMETSNPDFGDSSISCACDRWDSKPEMVMAFNGNYLLDAIKELDAQKIHIEIKDDVSPVRFSVCEEPLPFSIVMPMRA